jgi:hypothetical protein
MTEDLISRLAEVVTKLKETSLFREKARRPPRPDQSPQ